MTAMTQEDVQQIPLLERQAQQQWHQVGHPGWSLQPLADQGVSATGHLLSPQVPGHTTPAALPVLMVTSNEITLCRSVQLEPGTRPGAVDTGLRGSSAER